MKTAAYIFSFYLVLLWAIPCCAFDECREDRTETAEAGGHDEGGDGGGTCSPFFNCGGCASVVTSMEPQWVFMMPVKPERSYAFFIPPFIPDVHFDFWQPPKIGY